MNPHVEPLKATDPKSFGGWKIKGRLGEGGYSTIFLGEKSGLLAAVKMIRRELLNDSRVFERFATEINNLERIDHPGIAKVIESDLRTDVPYIAVEYIEGETLEQHVNKYGALKEDAWLECLIQVAEALDYCHKIAIIHKDVSPGNIILSQEGPKLIDFGISYHEGDQRVTQRDETVGTPQYMSPEHWDSNPRSQMDIFSLGSTFTFAGTGHAAFGGAKQESREAIWHIRPNFEGLSETQIKLLTPLLYKNFKDRPNLSELIKAANQLRENPESSIFESYLKDSDKKLVKEKFDLKETNGHTSKYLFIGSSLILVLFIMFSYLLSDSRNTPINMLDKPMSINSTVTPSNDLSPAAGDASQQADEKSSESTASSPLNLTAPTSSIPPEIPRNENEIKCSAANEANLIDEAIRFCQLATQEKDPRGTFLLGSLYIVKKDDQNAEKYLLQAAEIGDRASLGVLGLFYENNKKDDKLAEVWYKKAVKAQWPQNYVLYGLFLEKQKNESEAEKYFLRAHKANERWGTFQLGNLYYKQNKIEMAEKYLLEASNTGDSTAMYTYAELRRNIFNDLETACKWYTSASKLSGARAGSSPSLAKSALVSYCQSGLTGTPILANDVVNDEQNVRPYNSGELTWIIPSENITADYNYVQFKQIKTDSLWKGISFANFAEPDGKKPWIQVTFNSPAKDLCFDFRLIKVEQSKVTKIWTLLPSNCYTYNNGIATRIER